MLLSPTGKSWAAELSFLVGTIVCYALAIVMQVAPILEESVVPLRVGQILCVLLNVKIDAAISVTFLWLIGNQHGTGVRQTIVLGTVAPPVSSIRRPFFVISTAMTMTKCTRNVVVVITKSVGLR